MHHMSANPSVYHIVRNPVYVRIAGQCSPCPANDRLTDTRAPDVELRARGIDRRTSRVELRTSRDGDNPMKSNEKICCFVCENPL